MPEQYTNFSNIIMDEQHMAAQANQFQQQQMMQQQAAVQQQIQQAQQQKIALGDRQMDMAKWYWGQREKIIERGDPRELNAFDGMATQMMGNHALKITPADEMRMAEHVADRNMAAQAFTPMAAGETIPPESSGQYNFAQANGRQYIQHKSALPESPDARDARAINLYKQERMIGNQYAPVPVTYEDKMIAAGDEGMPAGGIKRTTSTGSVGLVPNKPSNLKDNTPPHIKNLQKFTDEHLQSQYNDFKAIEGNILSSPTEKINARNTMQDILGIMDERAQSRGKAEPQPAAQGGEDKSSAYSKFELLPGESVYVQALKSKGYSIGQIQSLLVKVRSGKLHPSAFLMPAPEQISEVGTTQADLAMAGSP